MPINTLASMSKTYSPCPLAEERIPTSTVATLPRTDSILPCRHALLSIEDNPRDRQPQEGNVDSYDLLSEELRARKRHVDLTHPKGRIGQDAWVP